MLAGPNRETERQRQTEKETRIAAVQLNSRTRNVINRKLLLLSNFEVLMLFVGLLEIAPLLIKGA